MNDIQSGAEDVGFPYGGITEADRSSESSRIWMAPGDDVIFGRAPRAGAAGIGEGEGMFGRGDAPVGRDIEADIDLDGEESRGESFGSSSEEEYVMPTLVDIDDVGASSGEGAGLSSSPADSAFSAPSTAPGGVKESMLAREGLEVYTVGHLMARSASENKNAAAGSPDVWNFNVGGFAALGGTSAGGGGQPQPKQGSTSPGSSSSGGGSGSRYADFDGESIASTSTSLINNGGSPPSSSSSPSSTGSTTSQRLRVRRSTFVPSWAVPPRVLLVDDDAVSRRVSSKFLEVFGCAIDVAVDGVGAVDKMNLEKYDLVLMVSLLSFTCRTQLIWVM